MSKRKSKVHTRGLTHGDTPEALAEIVTFSKSLLKESDRGAVLVVAAHADNLLESLLRSICEPGDATEALFAGVTAPFGSFSARIKAGLALGLLSAPLYRSLEQLREARNHCAHHVMEVDFTDQKLSAHIAAIELTPLLPELLTGYAKHDETDTARSRLVAFAGELLGWVRIAVREARPHTLARTVGAAMT